MKTEGGDRVDSRDHADGSHVPGKARSDNRPPRSRKGSGGDSVLADAPAYCCSSCECLPRGEEPGSRFAAAQVELTYDSWHAIDARRALRPDAFAAQHLGGIVAEGTSFAIHPELLNGWGDEPPEETESERFPGMMESDGIVYQYREGDVYWNVLPTNPELTGEEGFLEPCDGKETEEWAVQVLVFQSTDPINRKKNGDGADAHVETYFPRVGDYATSTPNGPADVEVSDPKSEDVSDEEREAGVQEVYTFDITTTTERTCPDGSTVTDVHVLHLMLVIVIIPGPGEPWSSAFIEMLLANTLFVDVESWSGKSMKSEEVRTSIIYIGHNTGTEDIPWRGLRTEVGVSPEDLAAWACYGQEGKGYWRTTPKGLMPNTSGEGLAEFDPRPGHMPTANPSSTDLRRYDSRFARDAQRLGTSEAAKRWNDMAESMREGAMLRPGSLVPPDPSFLR